ncbi:DUF4430 domain-containing protein [Paenibacillus borealis]|uniref:DUF4430 domain-containing protein n=1 Tax=Paenibacillus borealis TaxID=160799 RepID=UPI0005AB5FF9|nr:DUF4430 domain-containing protein [Paenibacillus borealis]
MFSLLKPVRARLYPLLLLLSVLLLAGCSQAQPDSAGGGLVPPAGSQAAQTPRPEGTAIPSATADGMAASAPAATAPAPGHTGAAEQAPAATGSAAEQAPAATGSAAEQASAATGSPAVKAPAATGKPAEQTPAATGKPAAATKQPAAAASSAAPRPAATAAPVNTVTLSITGDKEHGVILSTAAYEIEKNETALELLKRITRKHKIQMEYQGSKTFAYVEGIDNLYEYDHGAESGWMYKVNGEFPSKASGSWIVNPGDTIEWLYTLDLGKDIGAAAP